MGSNRLGLASSGSRGRYERLEFTAEFAGLFCATRSAFLDHERAKSELKTLVPEDVKEATGHGVRARRSKSAQSASISCDGGEPCSALAN